MTCAPIILFVAATAFLIGGIAGACLVHLLWRINVHPVRSSDETIYGDVPHMEGR